MEGGGGVVPRVYFFDSGVDCVGVAATACHALL